VEEVFLGLVLLPGQLLVAGLGLVALLGLELGLVLELFLAEAVGAALVLLQRDRRQQQPGGDEALVVDAALLFGREGLRDEQGQRDDGQDGPLPTHPVVLRVQGRAPRGRREIPPSRARRPEAGPGGVAPRDEAIPRGYCPRRRRDGKGKRLSHSARGRPKQPVVSFPPSASF